MSKSHQVEDNIQDEDLQPIHPIQVVARRTGLSADVIRAWERRYAAVEPHRTDTNRRLYTNRDVERLLLMSRAIASGRRIGDVANLSVDKLRGLVGINRLDQEQGPVTVPKRIPVQDHFDTCLAAVQHLDPWALETALGNAAAAVSVPILLNEIVSALMVHIGEQWRSGWLRPCHEHMTTAVLRSFLGEMALSRNMTGTGPVLVVTTPVGQYHELGALMVAVVAASGGWQPLYLGPNTPNDEIAFAALAKAAAAVALSISHPTDDPRLADRLRKLRRQLPQTIPLLAGGAAAPGYKQALDEIGARQPAGLDGLHRELDRLRTPQR